ncbi:Uncharacterised protein [Mycobacterium tuberculosis]|nr:Uncharacterised protein [Mycobacterium tuberculosis]
MAAGCLKWKVPLMMQNILINNTIAFIFCYAFQKRRL